MSSILSALQQAQQQRQVGTQNQETVNQYSAINRDAGSAQAENDYIEPTITPNAPYKTTPKLKWTLLLIIVTGVFWFAMDYADNDEILITNTESLNSNPTAIANAPTVQEAIVVKAVEVETTDKPANVALEQVSASKKSGTGNTSKSSKFTVNGLLYVADNDPLNKVFINNVSLRQGSFLPSGESVHYIGFDKVLLRNNKGQMITLVLP